MVPFRSLVILTIALVVTPGGPTRAQEGADEKAKPEVKASVASPAARPAAIPIESRPYKIRAYVHFDPMTRIDARARDRLLEGWRNLARHLVGPAWELHVAESDGPASAVNLSELTAAELMPLGVDSDKVWLIQGRVVEGAILLTGRELDTATGWVGSIHSRPVPFAKDLVRELFRLSEALFAPFAEIGEPSGDAVPLRVQASALPAGQGGDVIAPIGSIFRPIRVYFKDDGSVISVEKVLFSYLRIEKHDGGTTASSLIRGVRDPLTKRISRKNRLIALGIKPAPMSTKLRFVRLGDRSPASGYVLAYRPVPQGSFRDVATTDREGRVSLPPGFADGLVVLRLIAGKAEPMFDLPIMPGETDEELTVPFDPKPHAITLQTQLDALRDSIVDVVAVRSRLERRMKAREEGDDWAGVEEVLVEFRKLPLRDVFLKRLEQLQDDATQLEAKTKSVVLTKNARAALTDTRSLIDRYLDDSLIRGYEEAVGVAKQRNAKASQSKAKSKSAAVIAPSAKPKAANDVKPDPKAQGSGVVPF